MPQEGENRVEQNSLCRKGKVHMQLYNKNKVMNQLY